jgi:4-alpha-glucanotransferase
MFALVFKYFSDVFASVSYACFKRFFYLFLLQLLHLDILKIDQVLHMSYAWEVSGGESDVRGSAGSLLVL